MTIGMKTYQLNREMLIRRPIEDVFLFFSMPENLAKITPKELNFRILTPQPIVMKAGAKIEYTIRLLGKKVHWVTLITDFEPPYSFVDEQLKGPYASWTHKHSFEQTEDGVRIIDQVDYAIPFGVLGELAHLLYVKKNLSDIFEYRKISILRHFDEKGSF